MGDEEHHAKLAKEKRAGALDEFDKGRYTIVGDLTLKAVEQAIEACASREDLHFHINPKTAHAERREWLRKNFPQISEPLTLLWDVYTDLGYDGLDGDRAEKGIKAMEEIFDVLQSETGIGLK